jgi:hypothetical protein
MASPFSFFTRLKDAATATMAEAVATAAKSVASLQDSLSLDALQEQFGDPSGRRALYEGLEVTYLTPRLLAMGFPCTPDTKIRSRNDAAAVALLLKERHEGHFMVWNLAEEGYNYGLFDNQVRRICARGGGAARGAPRGYATGAPP